MPPARPNVCSICGAEPPEGAQVCPLDGSTLFVEPPPPDPLVGLQLGDYRVLEPIGEGGMGLVYRGVQPVIKKRVAIKVLRAEFAADPVRIKGLLREAEAVNSISHRNIIDIFGFGQLPDGRHYIVMEYLDGEPLDSYLEQKAPLKPLEAVELMIDICDPLGGAHAAGVVHRDLKPSNVFLVRQPNGTRYLKLLDFGLAKQITVDPRSAETAETQITGTPDYMAPEQCRGADDISFRSDLYALGVIGWLMLTGKLPFPARTPLDVMIKQIQEKPARPSTLQEGIPPELDVLIGQLMEKDPELRPPNAESVLKDLKQIGRRLRAGPAAVRTRMWTDEHPAHRPARKRSRLGWAVAGGLGLVVGLGAVGWLQWGAVEPVPPPTRIEPPAVAAAPVAPVEPAPAVAIRVAGEPAEEELDAGARPEPGPRKVARPLRESAPTVAALTRRIRLLEVRLRKITTRGAEPDPSAIQLLNKQRLRLSLVLSSMERREVAKKLDSWERTFLP